MNLPIDFVVGMLRRAVEQLDDLPRKWYRLAIDIRKDDSAYLVEDLIVIDRKHATSVLPEVPITELNKPKPVSDTITAIIRDCADLDGYGDRFDESDLFHCTIEQMREILERHLAPQEPKP